MKHFKKGMAALLIFALAFCLIACGSQNEAKPSESATAAPTESATPSPQETAAPSESADASAATKAASIEEYLNQANVKSAMENAKESVKNMGLDLEVSADGNKMIYCYTYQQKIEITDAVKEALEKGLEAQASAFESVADSLKQAVDIEEPIIVVQYLNADGSEIFTKEFS